MRRWSTHLSRRNRVATILLHKKEVCRLIQQVDFEKAQQKKLEKDTKRTQTLLKEEKLKHQQFVVLLVKERKRLASKLIEERQKNRELSQQLDMERGEVRSMAEGLMQEGKKSLKMEAEMEKYLSEFDIEREQLKAKLHREENRTKELRDEVSKLKHQILELEEQLRKSEHRIRGRDNQKSSVTSISMVSSVKDQGKSRSDPGMTDSKCDKRSVGATSPRPSKTSYTPTKPGSSYSIRTVEDESGKIEVKFTPKSGKTGIPVKHEGNSTNAAVAQGKPTVPVRLNTSPTSPTNPSSGKKSPVNPRGTPPPVPPNKPVFSPLSSFKKDANKNSPPAAVRPDSLVEARKQFYASKFGADGNIDNRQLSNANDSIGEGDHSPVSSPDSTSSGSSTSSVVMRPSKSTSPGSETGWEAASLTNATATMSDTENRNDTNVTDIEQILVNMTSGKIQKTTLA
uniref:CTTNBP2 N-terminal-like protein-like n=1 Tax=Saccoglossus kowalevskii TaxID=10224 RepID=A0ABM0MLG0_SACKO|nr:PREDICTED: CTTNBP2 N-terminal-like protein-like [Saccoglossus kowalevskii]